MRKLLELSLTTLVLCNLFPETMNLYGVKILGFVHYKLALSNVLGSLGLIVGGVINTVGSNTQSIHDIYSTVYNFIYIVEFT